VTSVEEARRVVGVPERVALMVIRAWIEAESDPPRLRARLLEIDELLEREVEPHVTVAAEVDEICAEVRRWLRALLASQDESPPSA
jgi:hypothetical protein